MVPGILVHVEFAGQVLFVAQLSPSVKRKSCLDVHMTKARYHKVK